MQPRVSIFAGTLIRSDNLVKISNMQRDSCLAFKDIHESPESMLESAQKICHPSILSIPSSDEALDLRFLTFDDDTPDLLLRLTEKGRHVGEMNYVAVSYTWQRFDPITNSEAVSTYLIAVGDSVRKARTQDAVLHRAIRFAKANDCRLIWIDQDCIDQTDGEDLDRYSHVVHNIFHRSRHAIGLLSFHILRPSQADMLKFVTEGACLRDLNDLHEKPKHIVHQVSKKLAASLRLFTAIAQDKWFSRAWVLMERLSAPHMRLLLPWEADLSPIPKKVVPNGPVDFEISCVALHQVRNRLQEISQSHTLDDKGSRRGVLREALGGTISQFERLLSTRYSAHSNTPPWLQPLTLDYVLRIFRSVEEADNTVLSDKLLMMSYLCGFSKRLSTPCLNHYEHSYSTCILILLLLNGWLPTRRGRMDSMFIWNHTLNEILAHWQTEKQHNVISSETIYETLDQAEIDQGFMDRLQDIVESSFSST